MRKAKHTQEPTPAPHRNAKAPKRPAKPPAAVDEKTSASDRKRKLLEHWPAG